MLAVITVIVPIFALVISGWIARKTGMLGAGAVNEINRFVIYLALPALLFDTVANADLASLWQPAFVATFGLGTAITFVVALVWSRLRARELCDAVVNGLNASYANTGFMGIPLILAVIGPSAMIPALLATIITVCILFMLAIVLIEIGQQPERRNKQVWLNICVQLVRNPMLVAPALGLVVLLLDIKIVAVVDDFLKLLGGAASPCALVGIGLFLAQRRFAPASLYGEIGFLVTLKLVIHPFITWVVATQVFHMSASMTFYAVLLAALPTGTGPFMVAQHYRRDGNVTSYSILLSTILSLLTIMGYLFFAEK